VRHLINVEPDPDWVTRPDVLRGLQVLGKRGLAIDYVGILPRHLEHLPVQAQRVPGLRIVTDHLGKPPIAAGEFEPWGSLLAGAARMPNVFSRCLVSTPTAAIGTAGDIAQYIDCPLETSPTAGKPSSQYRPTAPRHEGCCHAVNEPPTHGFGFR
jgi:L-fuconolactonase